MDTMSNIVRMFNENTKRYDDISQEIKEVRKEINNKK